MSIIIRQASIQDLKQIQELNYKLFECEHNNYNSELNLEWTFSEKGTTYFKELIEKGTVWVAVNNNKVVGYLAGTIKEKLSYLIAKTAELDNFYVDIEFRRKGIGNKLVQAFKEYCFNLGIDIIIVTANSCNSDALTFYKNVGFEDYETTYKMKLKK